MNVTVVGAGLMGLSSAWALARAGHRVSVFEQGPIPNPLGSSVDQHRLIRFPYGAARGYTRMVRAAYAAWETLWQDLGERHYAGTGTLVLETGEGSWARESADTLAAEGIAVRELTAGEVERALPMLDAGQVRFAFHLDSGGVLFAAAIVAALARHLRARGVEIVEHARVRAIDADRATVVLADARTRSADALVVAAGPWVPRLVPHLASRVTPSRQVAVYLAPPAEFAAAWTRAPMILDIDPRAGFYLVPPCAGTGLKLGDHKFSLSGDPDRDRQAGAEEAHQIMALAARRLRDFGRYRLVEAKTCFYDVEARERFIVERLGRAAWVMSGFSGHGFKFGPLLGLELARTIAEDGDGAALTAWAAGALERASTGRV